MATSRARCSPDGCIVDSVPLATMLHTFVDDWQRDRPSNAGRYEHDGERTSVPMYRALDALSDESGVSRETIKGLLAKNKRGKPRPRYATTELRIADPLVSAMNFPEAWHNGTLSVRPNPLASRAARAQCCTGSLNGSLT